MKKRVLCTFNGTKSQARDLVGAWKEEQAKKAHKAKMERYFTKTAQVWAEREAWERSYFAEAV